MRSILFALNATRELLMGALQKHTQQFYKNENKNKFKQADLITKETFFVHWNSAYTYFTFYKYGHWHSAQVGNKPHDVSPTYTLSYASKRSPRSCAHTHTHNLMRALYLLTCLCRLGLWNFNKSAFFGLIKFIFFKQPCFGSEFKAVLSN